MARVMLISLPWPNKDLSLNARVHHFRRARATKTARRIAWGAALAAQVPTDQKARLRFEYFPPDNRRRDAKNMPNLLKAYIDGIADAMGCDDHEFMVVYSSEFSPVVNGGRIICTIETGEEK